jgi:hypothetical protein
LALSAIGVWLLFDFGRQFNKPPDGFSSRWKVGLRAAPVVYRPQKLLRYPHLQQAILRVFRWAATGALIADTAQNIPGGTLDRRYLDNLFRDLLADALAVIRNAAEEMREYENWRAS